MQKVRFGQMVEDGFSAGGDNGLLNTAPRSFQDDQRVSGSYF
jgi:hypothetical protein